MTLATRRALTPALLAASALLAAALPAANAGDRAADQSTQAISRSMTGGVPNGPSGNSVISGDKRWARVIAYESEASDIVPGDTNGAKDIFAVTRANSAADKNTGQRWEPGATALVSKTSTGGATNGPSWAPAIDGQFHDGVAPTCIAYLSSASNIVPGDTNGKVDAFVAKLNGSSPQLVSRAGNADTTAVAVSQDCKQIATIKSGRLWIWEDGEVRRVSTRGRASEPSFSVGEGNDLVFATPSGVYLLQDGKKSAKLVARRGKNPTYNSIKRQVVAYERTVGGHTQVFYRDLTKEADHAEVPVSAIRGTLGNGNSRDPIVVNSGYAILFETDATNLGVNSLGRPGDENGRPDVYLYTDVRKLTLVQSVLEKAVPLAGGGANGSTSYYYNYVTFDSAADMLTGSGTQQVFMRYLGSV